MYDTFFVGPYLIVVTKKRFIGEIDGHFVYEATGSELVSFSRTTIHLAESQVLEWLNFGSCIVLLFGIVMVR